MNYYLAPSQRDFMIATLSSIYSSYRRDSVDEYKGKVNILNYYLISQFKRQLHSVMLVMLMEKTKSINDDTINILLDRCTYEIDW